MYTSSFNNADYYSPKRLLVIALDKSESMDFCGMQEINDCMKQFVEEIGYDEGKFSSVELSVVAFNEDVELILDSSNIADIQWPEIRTEGNSNIIVGLEKAINVLKARVDYYITNGCRYYKPWLILITNDENHQNYDVSYLASQIRADVRAQKYEFLPVGVGNVSMHLLEELKGAIMPVKLQSGRYNTFFNWLYTTIGNFSFCKSPMQQLDDIRPRIFISYKRVDKNKVLQIKKHIEDSLDLVCWFDMDGIESDAQFANVIINAINRCEIFLFMYSQAHTKIEDFDNDWTIREINFAQKKGKRIVFVNIDGTELSDWFEMMFGTKQQVDANSAESMKKLLFDISNWLDL